MGWEVLPFCALHRPGAAAAALAGEGLRGLKPTMLPLPRPALYEAWARLGRPDVTRMPGLGRADVVFAPSVAVPPRGRRPLVVTVHDAAPCLFPESFPARGLRFHLAGLDAAARRADVVITVSESSRAELAAHTDIPASRIRVVPNGVDAEQAAAGAVEDLADRLGLSGRPYVLWVGSLEPRKNVEALLGLPAALRAAGLPHRLVLAGPDGWGPTAEAARAAAAGAREGSLRLVGRVPAADLAALYAGASLFCFPSIHEGFGLPVLEAMAQGTPVLCSRAASLPEVAGPAARYVDDPGSAAWDEAVVQLLADGAALAEMAAAGRARAAGFTWAACARATGAALRDAMGAG